MSRTLSIVVPLHNEAESLPLVLAALRKSLADWGGNRETILVDDGSHDDSWAQICAAARQYPQTSGIRFTRNFGKEAAILAGLEAATGDWVVVIDGDGQHPPTLLPKMLERAEDETVAIVAARKRSRDADGWVTRFVSHTFNRVMHAATGFDMQGACDYRLMKRPVVNTLLSMPERIRFFRAMTVWTGFRQVDVDFDVPPRVAGSTSWTRRSLVRLAITAITGFSAKPLMLVFHMGIVGLGLSVLLALQALWSWVSGVAVSGWTSLALLMVFFGSSILVGIGLLGLYLGQLFDEIKARPAYLVGERMDAQAPTGDHAQEDFSRCQ